MKTGIELIAEERQRQIKKEGWTIEHDLQHTRGELANAAACYAMTDNMKMRDTFGVAYEDGTHRDIPVIFPFDEKFYKPTPKDRIKELVKAGALIAAEIDRLNNEKVVCPKCLKPVGDCKQYPFYHNRIRYICPHCKYDGDSIEFETVYSTHPIHNIIKEETQEKDNIQLMECKKVDEWAQLITEFDLEKEIDRIINTPENQGNPELKEDLVKVACHFAEWQKKQMMKHAIDTAGLTLSWFPDSKAKIIVIDNE